MMHSYSRTGNFNLSRNYENQDHVFSYQNDAYVFIAAADGVSECVHGTEGAMTACRAAADMLLNEAERVLRFSDEKLSYLLIEHVMYVLERAYGRESTAEYASTLVCALICIKSGEAVVFNLGDGAVLSLCSGRLHMQMMPRCYEGIPAQTVTRNAYKAAEIKRFKLRAGETLLLFTDGMMSVFSENGGVSKAMQAGDIHAADDALDDISSDDDMSYVLYRHL